MSYYTRKSYYQHIYRLRYITRYSNRLRNIEEDVAQHSFFVAAIILELYDHYEFDLGIALQAAIAHDILEADISDITHDIKVTHPELNNAIIAAEHMEISNYPLAVQRGYFLFDSHTVEGKIAQLADVLQVYQYILAEESLGNITTADIRTASEDRITQLEKELKDHERH